MAFVEERMPVARQFYFTFFANGVDAGVGKAAMAEDFNPGYAFELEKIRLRLSVAHASVHDFVAFVSHHNSTAVVGSVWDHNLISQAMLGVQDVMYQPGATLKLHHNDTIRLSMHLEGDSAGGTNKWGLEISGWAITQPAGG